MEFNLAITLEHDFVREPIRTSVVLNDAVLYKGNLTEKVLEFTCEAKNEKNSTYLSKNGYYEIKFDLPIKNFLQRYYSKWDKYKVIDTEKEIRSIDKFLESIK